MKPSPDQLLKAIRKLSVLNFFPADADAREGIYELLGRMVSTTEQLDWLVQSMINQVGEWNGPRELRGVFCTRFSPADKIESYCVKTPNFTPTAIEAENTTQRLPAGKTLMLTAGDSIPPEEVEANNNLMGWIEAAPLKRVPKATKDDIAATRALFHGGAETDEPSVPLTDPPNSGTVSEV